MEIMHTACAKQFSMIFLAGLLKQQYGLTGFFSTRRNLIIFAATLYFGIEIEKEVITI